MNKQLMSIESLDAAGRGVRVEFFRAGDRYAHRLLAVDGNASIAALASLEAAGDDFSTPTFQDLNVQSVPGRSFAALVGMSGSNHWSLTVEQAIVDDRPAILFDAACRIKQALPRLSSRYAGGKAELLTLEADSIEGESALEVVESPEEISLYRRITSEEAPPITLRWRYSVKIC